MSAPRRPRIGRVRGLTLRTRLLLVALVGVALVTAIGGAALYAVLRYTGLHTLDRDSAATAAQVASLVRTHRLPDPVPVTGNQVVQVLDRRLRVVSASTNADRLTALLEPEELRRAVDAPIEVPGARVGVDGELRVAALPVSGTSDTVVVARQLDQLRRSAQVLRNGMLVTYPLLLAVLGLIAWRVIGATLRPVERLRVGAERISGSGDRERLPVPSSADEVHALAVTLNSMLDRLAASRESQRAFVADVAHELRSPLASVRAQLEIAQRLGEGGQLVEDLHADVLRMSALVEDLLTLARLDADTVPARPGVRVFVTGALAEVAERHRCARVAVTVRPTPSELAVRSDPDELARVLTNLVDNAVRHAVCGVELSAVARGETVVAVVEDDGPGIAAADRDRVLRRFVRLDDSRDRDAGGTGLGLAIVHELVSRRGGTVRLSDASLGGLRVEVVLPRSR